jgi:hypothetical protein
MRFLKVFCDGPAYGPTLASKCNVSRLGYFSIFVKRLNGKTQLEDSI